MPIILNYDRDLHSGREILNLFLKNLIKGEAMDNVESNDRKITSEKAKSILEQAGREVSVEEAGVIVSFMYFIASLAIKQYMDRNVKS